MALNNGRTSGRVKDTHFGSVTESGLGEPLNRTRRDSFSIHEKKVKRMAYEVEEEYEEYSTSESESELDSDFESDEEANTVLEQIRNQTSMYRQTGNVTRTSGRPVQIHMEQTPAAGNTDIRQLQANRNLTLAMANLEFVDRNPEQGNETVRDTMVSFQKRNREEEKEKEMVSMAEVKKFYDNIQGGSPKRKKRSSSGSGQQKNPQHTVLPVSNMGLQQPLLSTVSQVDIDANTVTAPLSTVSKVDIDANRVESNTTTLQPVQQRRPITHVIMSPQHMEPMAQYVYQQGAMIHTASEPQNIHQESAQQ